MRLFHNGTRKTSLACSSEVLRWPNSFEVHHRLNQSRVISVGRFLASRPTCKTAQVSPASHPIHRRGTVRLEFRSGRARWGCWAMSDTRTLLDRIASFRERLERTPNLIPDGTALDDPEVARGRTAAMIA